MKMKAFYDYQPAALIFLPLIFMISCSNKPKKFMELPKAMTLVNNKGIVDENLFMRNPVWGLNAINPNASLFPDKFCPCESTDHDNPKAWISKLPNCTNDNVTYNGPNVLHNWQSCVCFGWGHMNYFPVTYEGYIRWEEWSDDWDYNFGMYREDKALYMATRNGIGTEFNSNETVEKWAAASGTWWRDFYHKVYDNDTAALHAIDGHQAIVIGLVGIDERHEVYTELHPVYAMCIQVNDSVKDDRWSFFVRNWGDEGTCGSSKEQYMKLKDIYLTIPHNKPFLNVKLKDHNVYRINDRRDTLRFEYQQAEDGVLLHFHLDTATKKTCFVGDISFEWTEKNNAVNLAFMNDFTSNVRSLKPKTEPEDGREIINRIYKLDSTSKEKLREQIESKFSNGIVAKKIDSIPKSNIKKNRIISLSEIKNIKSKDLMFEIQDSVEKEKYLEIESVKTFLNERNK